MTPRQIIIQAGGRGSRLEQHTSNKPKCLVPVDGKPLLYHTLAAFPGAEAVVIVDYRADVVRRWLEAFPPDRPITVVHADGKGSGAGLARAARALSRSDDTTAVVWCDLVFEAPPPWPVGMRPVIGVTKDFSCRYETPSRSGVMGLFWFHAASILTECPPEGEFSEWVLAHPYIPLAVQDVREYGTLAALQNHWSDTPTRFFNEIEIGPEIVTKRARLPEYLSKIEDEAAWYRHVWERGFGNVPRVIAESPLEMTRITGQHPWQMKPDTRALGGIMGALERLHKLETLQFDQDAIAGMYLQKPIKRMVFVANLLPPELRGETVVINGHRCQNRVLGGGWSFDVVPEAFTLIHGDPTFSNIIITRHGFPFLIDPRGRFGDTQFYGDPLYDWAKLWYSLVGGYDNFNRKQFTLEMGDGCVEVQIKPSGWEMLAPMFEERMGAETMRKIKI